MQVTWKNEKLIEMNWLRMHQRWTAQLKRNLHGLNRARKVYDECAKISDCFRYFPDWTDMSEDTKAIHRHIMDGISATELQIKKMKRDRRNEVTYCRAILKNIEEAMTGRASDEVFDRLVAIERVAHEDTQMLCHVLPGKETLGKLRADIEYTITKENTQSEKSRKRDELYKIAPESDDESDREIDAKYGNESEDGMDKPEGRRPYSDVGESGDDSSEADYKPKQKSMAGKRQTTGFKKPPSKQQQQQKKKKGAKSPPTARRTRATSAQASRQSSPEEAGPSTDQVVPASAAPRPVRRAARVAEAKIKKSAKAQKSFMMEAEKDVEPDEAESDEVESIEDADDESEDHEDEDVDDKDQEFNTAAADKPKEPAQAQEPIVIDSDEESDSTSDDDEDKVKEPAKPEDPIVIDSDEDTVSTSDDPEAEDKEAEKEPEQPAKEPEQPARQQTAGKQPAAKQPAGKQPAGTQPAHQQTAGKHPRKTWNPPKPVPVPAEYQEPTLKEYHSKPTNTGWAGWDDAAIDDLYPTLSEVYEVTETRSIGTKCFVATAIPLKFKGKGRADDVKYVASGYSEAPDHWGQPSGSKFRSSVAGVDIPPHFRKVVKVTDYESESEDSEPETGKGPAVEPLRIGSMTQKPLPKGKAVEAKTAEAKPAATDSDEMEVHDESKKAQGKMAQPSNTSTKKRGAAKEPDTEKAVPLATSVTTRTAARKKVSSAANQNTDNEQPIPTKAAPKGKGVAAPKGKEATTTESAQPVSKPQPPAPKIKKEVKEPENRFQLSKTKNSDKVRGSSASTDITQSSTKSQPSKQKVKKEPKAPTTRSQLSNAGTKGKGRARSDSTDIAGPADPPPPRKPPVKKVVPRHLRIGTSSPTRVTTIWVAPTTVVLPAQQLASSKTMS